MNILTRMKYKVLVETFLKKEKKSKIMSYATYYLENVNYFRNIKKKLFSFKDGKNNKMP